MSAFVVDVKPHAVVGEVLQRDGRREEVVELLRQGDGARQGVQGISQRGRSGEGGRADGRRGGARGGGCRVDAGEVLDDATAEDGAVQGSPVVEVRRAERLGIDVDLHERIFEGLKDHAQPDVVGA